MTDDSFESVNREWRDIGTTTGIIYTHNLSPKNLGLLTVELGEQPICWVEAHIDCGFLQ